MSDPYYKAMEENQRLRMLHEGRLQVYQSDIHILRKALDEARERVRVLEGRSGRVAIMVWFATGFVVGATIINIIK